MSTLDVGSGANPHGDVNLDIHTGYSPHAEMVIKKPTIRADAHHLPFQNEVFGSIYCSHTLEHLDNPPLALCEMKRVLRSNGNATFEAPNSNIKPPSMQLHLHKHFWNMNTFARLLAGAGLKIENAEYTGESNLRIRIRKLRHG